MSLPTAAAKIAETERRGNALLKELGMAPEWFCCVLDLAAAGIPNAGGFCFLAKRGIVIDISFVARNGFTAIDDVIKHEAAHAMCDRPGHDDEWREHFLSLGGSGRVACPAGLAA